MQKKQAHFIQQVGSMIDNKTSVVTDSQNILVRSVTPIIMQASFAFTGNQIPSTKPIGIHYVLEYFSFRLKPRHSW